VLKLANTLTCTCLGCALRLLASGLRRLGTVAIGFSAIGNLMAALFTLNEAMLYPADAYPVTNSSVVHYSVTLLPSSGEEA
jgi:hypothetical protein